MDVQMKDFLPSGFAVGNGYVHTFGAKGVPQTESHLLSRRHERGSGPIIEIEHISYVTSRNYQGMTWIRLELG
jgi:hypothetical protein